MNIRSLRTLGLASVMAMSMNGSKAAAQTTKVAAPAAKTIVADTVKVVKETPTVLLKRYKGHFDGKVMGDSLAGNLQYQESARTVLSPANSKVNNGIHVDAGYTTGSLLANNGVFGHGQAKFGNNAFDVTGAFAEKGIKSDFVAKATYTREFPITDGLSATATGGVEGCIRRVRGKDSLGEGWPLATAGLKYEHKFNNGVRVAAKGEAGMAASIVEKRDTERYVPKKSAFIANGEAEIGLNRTSAVIKGGKDAVMGNYLQGGVRVHF